MTANTLSVTTTEHPIPAALGRLYAKRWHPAATSGAKAPIILVHDSLGAVALWRDFPEQLAQATGRDVVAYDRLGFGLSDPNPQTLAASFVEDEVEEGLEPLLNALAIDDFVVLGHSVGGGMAAFAAARYGARCKALITESVQTFVEDRTLKGIGEARDTFAQPGQIDRLARYHGDKAPWVLSAWVDTWFSKEFANFDLQPAFAAVHCPIMAIHGDSDEYGSLIHPQNIARWTGSNTRAEVIAGGGHVPHREMTAAIVELIAGFLAPL